MRYLLISLFGLILFSAQSQNKSIDTIQNINLKKAVISNSRATKIDSNKGLEIQKVMRAAEPIETISQIETPIEAIVDPDSITKQHQPIIVNPIDLKGLTLEYAPASAPKGVTAVPGNDLICNASVLPVNGTCLTSQTTIDATSDYSGGCIPSGSVTVFYKFTITGTNNMMTVALDNFPDIGRQVYFYLMNGDCASPTAIRAECGTSINPLTQKFYNLSAGTYYLMIGTQPGASYQLNSFRICGTQSVAPTRITGPEQDCAGATPVCDVTYVQNISYTGYGSYQEINYGSTCLTGGESNSVWYIFTPQTSGDFAFTITTTKDYDWALYNLTAIGGCSHIPGATPVLCNYSGTYGNTGTTLPVNATIPRSLDASGSKTMPGVPVTAGNTYALIVNNYTADINGYTLSFETTTGTASFIDSPPSYGEYPRLTTASVSCTSNTIAVNTNENVKCSTISPSDFTLTNTTTNTNFTSAITQITGVGCTVGGFTNQLTFTHNGTLTTGVYQIKVNSGAILSDKCGNRIQAGGTVNFNYLAPLTLTSTPNAICFGQTVSLNANGADGSPSLTTYTLNPGGLTNTTNGVFNGVSPAITTNYTVSATYGGCTRTANTSVTVEGNIIATISPANKTICSAANVTLTASTSINGVNATGCTYHWSTGANTPSIVVNTAGTYTVTATTSTGCVNSNSPTSIITVAGTGTGGGTCDVLYVSPAGGGTGLTKASPTTLADAVTKALCTSTIIKMQKGVYTLTNYQFVPGFITIEGGYDALFTTKSSDMTGGANSTTIRRTNAPDVLSPNTCTAFRVDDGAVQFRIQDIRIEMPGSTYVSGHALNAAIVNYGIKLGTACSAYNIIRCYIDAGKGANR